jgi:hypothetical protein
MKMKSIRAALAAGLFGAASLVALQAFAADSGPKVSKDFAKPISDAQALMKAGDMKGAMDKINEAAALPNPTPDDSYVINEFKANIAISLKDYATATTAFEAMADSPSLPADQKASTLHNAIILATNAKDYAKAVTYGNELIAMGPVDDKVAAALSESYYYQKDYAHAKEMAQKSVDAAKAAGQPPDRGALQIIMNSEANAHDEAGAEATLEQLAMAYNDPADWGQLLDLALGTKGLRDIDALYLNRLRIVTGGAGKVDDYTLIANVALQMGFPGEAQAALEAGIQKGAISDSGKVAALLSQARSKAAADQKSLGAQIAMGEKQGGEYNVKLAEALYGYGRYADAEAAARRAQAKGGTKDPTEAPMVLGMALVGEGKYAEAATTFQSVNGGAATNRAAHLWANYANGKAAPAAASAAPAAAPAQ